MKSLKNAMMRAAMLLLAVMTSATALAANTEEPYYHLDYIKGGTGCIFIKGWAVDKNYRDRPIGPDFIFYSDAACNNRVWRDGAELVNRPDVNAQYNTTGDHGFEAAIPVARFADFMFPEGATEHTFYVRIFVNNTSQEVFEMEGSPFPVTVKKIWGEGTEENPFLICNAGEWDSLAGDMADSDIGDYYADKFYELANDEWFQFDNTTAATKMWGTEARPFAGNFDGNGKTLNVNIIKNNSTDGFAAPFYHVNGASIHDLTVAGSVSGMYFAGGIVLMASGTLNLQNCVCSAAISGFNMYAGGLIAYCKDLTLKLQNCLFKGSFSPGSNGKYHPIALKNATATVTASAAVCVYYLSTAAPSEGLDDNIIIKRAKGFPLSTDLVDGVWDEPVTAIDGQTYYAAHFTGKRLPYEYGFENNDLSAEGWMIVDNFDYTLTGGGGRRPGIGCSWDDAIHSGDYAFRFPSWGDDARYLVSPEFSGHSPILVRFYYTKYVYVPESASCQVGYSTTTPDIDAFTWGETNTSSADDVWELYERTFPKGTKYIVVKYLPNDTWLYIDDFSFAVCDTPSPLNLKAIDVTEYTASLSWEAPTADYPITGYAYQYKKANDAEWSDETTVSATTTSAIIDGLSANTDYQFRVKALYGEHGESIWLPTQFTTALELPYVIGFENGMDHWSMVDNCYFLDDYTDTGISDGAACDGEKGFVFISFTAPQYLISPRCPGTSEMTVSFYYRDCDPGSRYWETFQVGYSTTTNDISDFTWGNDIVAKNIPWTLYERTFPVGTRYIAIRYMSILTAGLYIDDFSFVEGSGYAKPTDLAVSDLTDQSAKLTWTAPNGARGYAYQYEKFTENAWSTEATVNATSVTLDGLEANTNYNFRVRALYADGNASNYETFSFLTEAPAVTSLPFTEGFENGMGGWRIVNGLEGAGIYSRLPDNIHEGNHSFRFVDDVSDNIEQYLISPQFDVIGPIKVSFYCKNNTRNAFYSFHVGYSTTGKALNDFTWSLLFVGPQWNDLTTVFPEGTKYVAIWQHTFTKSDYELYLDDFTFESSSITPIELQDIAATDIAATSANITWTGEAETFEVNFREKARFHDDFEGGIGQWTAFERTNVMFESGAITSWQKANPGNISSIAVSYNYYKNVDDDNNPTGTTGVYDLDDWIISPKMPLTGTLTFQARFDPLSDDYDEENDKCEVLVSTTTDNLQMLYIDPSIFTAIDRIYPTTDNTSFNRYRYSLDSYNGQEGYIAFRHKSAHKSMFYIDNVYVYRTTDEFTTQSTTENNLRLTGLEPQTSYEFQVRSFLYNNVSPWSDLATFTTEDFKSLSENSDNTQTIAALANGQKHDVILQGHTFYRHRNEWNTLCVPFDVSDFSGTPLEGATVKAVSGSDFTDGTLTMNFTEATSIEAGRPYIVTWANGANLFITNEAEWRRLAERVAGGEDFAGKNVVLMADFDVSTMVGTAEHPFCGIFDGNGHTLNVSINDAEYAALFRYIDGAVIRNLKVTGSVNGGSYCAGIVGAALGGTNSIRNCWMAASVTSSANIGGVLGHGTNSSTTISNCFLNGSLKGNSIGVFYGWGSGSGVHAIENCWAYGSYDNDVDVDLLMSDGGTTSVTNCLKNRDDISQGSTSGALYTNQFVTFLGNQWAEDESGNLVLKPSADVAVDNIENPLFLGVNVSNDAPTPIDLSCGQFVGTYSPLADTGDMLMDANNAGNGAFHAAICSDPSALGQDFMNWYNDEMLTSPATVIPFDADGNVTLYTGLWVTLADAADNSETIETIVNSGRANNRVAVLKDRTLYRDGDWNSLCLPFSLNEAQIAASSMAGVTMMELSGTTSNLTNGTLTLNFRETYNIEAGRPYIVKWQHPTVVINNTSDWESFASAVNNGTESYAGKLVKLGADISVSTMVGTAEHPFRGTFDGNGHALNLSINDADAAYAAPFRYIQGATIRNLKVTGSVNGGSYCAGIVGAALGGTNNIRNCWMAASVTSSANIGGVLGHGTNSSTTISNCYLTGSLKGYNIGVFYGWGSGSGIHAIENCWTVGSYDNTLDINLLMSDGGTTSITNCIKNGDDITQGSTSGAWYDSQKAFFLGSQWTTDDNGMLVLKPSIAYDNTAIEDPVFSGVNITSTSPTPVAFTGGQFVGTYNPVGLSTPDFLIDANSTLYHPAADMTLNACRGYFQLSDPNATVNTIVLKFNDSVGILLGDVNGDGTVSPADAIMILYHYFNVVQNGFNAAAADMNGDQNITPADAIEALYKFFGSSQSHAPRKGQPEREPQ